MKKSTHARPRLRAIKRVVQVWIAMGFLAVGSVCPDAMAQDVAPGPLFRAGIDVGCGAGTEELISAFRATLEELTELCEVGNQKMEEDIGQSCPMSSCFAGFEAPRASEPTLSISVSYSDSLSSSVTGTSSKSILTGGIPSFPSAGGISGGVTRTTSTGRNRGIVLSVGLVIPLGKRTRALKCENPMSQAMRDGLVDKVLTLASESVRGCRQ